MSSIAEILINLGYIVSGSDIKESEVTDRLKSLGAIIYEGHNYSNVGDSDVLVFSSAVKPPNVEFEAAKDNGIPAIGRAEMLAELMRMKRAVCIAGTHGKSTTTSMSGELLFRAGFDPTIIIGGKTVNIEGSSRLGKSEYMVVEADEFDKAFLSLTPTIAVATTLEREHMECYDGMDDLRGSFLKYLNSVPFYGAAIFVLMKEAFRSYYPI
jgi:UDP-N-acetylmuramate--alanine ligase